MSVLKAIARARNRRYEKGWDKTYWLIDWHDTMAQGSYDKDKLSVNFYPFALEVLQHLSNMPDQRLIIWTSSYPEDIMDFLQVLSGMGVSFDYHNGNPEVTNTNFGYFNEKPYFDIIVDDKAGFDADTDWELIYQSLMGTLPPLSGNNG